MAKHYLKGNHIDELSKYTFMIASVVCIEFGGPVMTYIVEKMLLGSLLQSTPVFSTP